MALKEFEQPEIININDSLRLRKYDGHYELFLPGYQNPVVYQNSEGIFDESKIPTLDYVKGMCSYLAKVGELYYIEAKENGLFRPIGDVTVKEENPPIAIWEDAYRGKGIGTELMKGMLQVLREKGYRQVSLSVQKANPAVKLYTKTGFVTVMETDEEYIMVCRL